MSQLRVEIKNADNLTRAVEKARECVGDVNNGFELVSFVKEDGKVVLSYNAFDNIAEFIFSLGNMYIKLADGDVRLVNMFDFLSDFQGLSGGLTYADLKSYPFLVKECLVSLFYELGTTRVGMDEASEGILNKFLSFLTILFMVTLDNDNADVEIFMTPECRQSGDTADDLLR